MHITHLHLDVVNNIFQQTDWHAPLKYVSKGFFNDFFHTFFKNCLDSPSLRDRANQIQRQHLHFSPQEKTKAIYNSLREGINLLNCKGEIQCGSQDNILKLKRLSIKHLHQWETWLEDISLIKIVEKGIPTSDISGLKRKALLEALDSHKTLSAKAEAIRFMLSCNEHGLAHVKNICLNGSFSANLTKLPREIGYFSKVVELYLSDNNFSLLSKEIDKLKNLKGIALCNNNLSVFPEEIGNLEQLEWLNLSNNQLSIFPEEIGKLKQLKHLSISDNQLSSLPNEIGHLQQLTLLDLANNQFSIWPEEIAKLKQLKYLHLSGNPLLISVEKVSKLSLSRLYYSSYQLKPEEKCKLQNEPKRLYVTT